MLTYLLLAILDLIAIGACLYGIFVKKQTIFGHTLLMAVLGFELIKNLSKFISMGVGL